MSIALSWSRWNDFMDCPRKFHLKYIAKSFQKVQQNFHLLKGANLHKQLEKYVDEKNAGTLSPTECFRPEVVDTIPLVDRLMSMYSVTHSETQLGMTADWKQTDWFASDVAWRAIMDFICVNPTEALIVDWKSGKKYDYTADKGQLHLSGLMGMEALKLDRITVSYVFIEHKHSSPIELTREKDLPALKAHFDSAYDQVNSEKEFKPKVNEYCKYCPATKAQCPFSKKF